MRLRHPYALDDDAPEPDDTVHWGGRRQWSDVDADDTFYVPDGRAAQFVESWPEANGYTLADLRVDEADGDSGEGSDDTTDGSDNDDADESEPTTAEYVDAGVCPWCDDYEGDHVGQHASSAHPDEWDAYKDDGE